MKTQPYNAANGIVKYLREIRDNISNEIKDMTFEQESAYLDKLLADKNKTMPNKAFNDFEVDTCRIIK